MLTNLLANAIQYNRDNGSVRIATAVQDDVALLTISDTGEGIAPADLPHVFEHFFRADQSRSRSEGHAGLGLAIVKAIVEAHQGTVEATSTPGNGTTFVVRLPHLPSVRSAPEAGREEGQAPMNGYWS